MTKRIAAAIFLVLASASAFADSCDTAITKAMLGVVAKNQKLGKTLVASTASDDVRPALIDWALRVRSRVVAEELVTSFRDRNVEPAEIDAKAAAPFALIALEDYMTNGAIDWTRVDADFPATQTIVELSRAGCDSLNAFAVAHLRYNFRTPSSVPESVLFHVTRQPDTSWEIELMRHSSQEAWQKSDCTHYTLPRNPDYPELCRAFTAQRGGA